MPGGMVTPCIAIAMRREMHLSDGSVSVSRARCAGRGCRVRLDSSGSGLSPAGEAGDLPAGECAHGPAVALPFERPFYNLLHLLDGAIIASKLPVLVAKAAVGLASAAIFFRASAAKVIGERHAARLA